MPPGTASQLTGERRMVTIMFADISGFTAIVEQLGPEEVCTLINRCFDRLVPLIERYGGVIDKFIGDEIMALFGAPIAHEDDPARALRAALDLMEAMNGFNVENGTDLDLHIGINTGLVVAGGIGARGQQRYSVIGNAVNLAARLRGLAQRGEILVGADTQRYTAPLFDLEAMAPISVKGLEEPLQVYRLLGPKAQPGSLRGLAGLYSPMVGRQEEAERLLALSHDLTAGRGHVVAVIGEAGLGKSRLVAEWQAAAAARYPSIRWARGNCLSYGQDMAHHLLLDMLRSLLGISPAANEAETQAALQAQVQACCATDAAEVYPYLAHLLSLKIDKQADAIWRRLEPKVLQQRYRLSLERLLRALAAQSPLALILEDIHWADLSSTELLISLLPLVQQMPLLFCLVTRPDREAAGWKLLNAAQALGADHWSEIPLDALSIADSQRLVSNLLEAEALPDAVRTLILHKAEGNPFFVEEVIRMLIDRGDIVRQGERWVTHGSVETIDLPDNLQGLLMARIDRLPEPARQVLRVAAVIGRQFPLRVLEESFSTSPPGRSRSVPPGRAKDAVAMIQSYLGVLEAAGLISLAQAEPEREYLFRHVLIQEAAYASMLREDRCALHRAVGQALERLYPERQAELAATLAYHFAEAGETQRALRYFTTAGDVAYSRYALPEAISHYTKGIGYVWQIAGDEIEERLCYLYTQRGRALELDARYEEALQNYAEAIRLGQARGFAALQLAALIEQAKVRLTPNPAYDAEQGKALAEEALALAERLGDRAAQARIYWIRMLGCWLDSKPAEAKAFGEQSLALARQLNLREQLAYTLNDLHRPYYSLGEYAQAAAALEESRRMWREMDNLPMLADNLASSADLYLGLGNYDRALELAEEAFHISHSIGNLWNQAFARQVTGEVYSNLGRFDLASAAILEAIALSEQAGPVILNARARRELAHLSMQVGALDQSRHILDALSAQLGNLGAFFDRLFVINVLAASAHIAVRQGDLERAERDIQEGISLTSSRHPSPEPFIPFGLLVPAGELALARGETERAIALADEAIARLVASPLGSHPAPHLLKGQALMARREWDAAAEALGTALRAEEAQPRRFLRWQILLCLSEAEDQRGNPATASELRQQAYALIEEIANQIGDPATRASFLAQPRARGYVPDSPGKPGT